MGNRLVTQVLTSVDFQGGFTSFRVRVGDEGNEYSVTFPLELFLRVGDRIDFSNATLKPVEGRIGHAEL